MILRLVAVFLCWDTGLVVPSIVNAIVGFWAQGVAANFRGDRPENVPSWTILAPITSALAVVLGLLGLGLR